MRLEAFERVGEVGRDRGGKLWALRDGEDAFGNLVFNQFELVGLDVADQLVDGAREQAVDGGVDELLGLPLERLAREELADAARQSLVDEVVNLAVNLVARDEDFFEEAELLVVVVHLALDEGAELLARVPTGGEIGEVLDD